MSNMPLSLKAQGPVNSDCPGGVGERARMPRQRRIEVSRGLSSPSSKEMNMFMATEFIGVFLIVAILWEAFETFIFPRRVTRRVRLTRIFYRVTWRAWKAAVHPISTMRLREYLLSIYGPLSLIVLLGLWAFHADPGVWAHSLGCSHDTGRPNQPGHKSLFQRNNFLHSRIGRSAAALAFRSTADSSRGGDGVWFSGDCHRLPAGS